MASAIKRFKEREREIFILDGSQCDWLIGDSNFTIHRIILSPNDGFRNGAMASVTLGPILDGSHDSKAARCGFHNVAGS